MTPRYRRARELAGLSLGQAANRLDVHARTLLMIEGDLATVITDCMERRMADVYGCSLAWLQGAEPDVPENTRKMLREADLNPTERDDLLELIGSIGTRR